MNLIVRSVFCSIVLGFIVSVTFAQEFEEMGLAPESVIKSFSNVREKPSAKSRKLKTVEQGTEIRIIDENPRNGYLRVMLDDGSQGYVYYKNVDLPADGNEKNVSASVLLSAATAPCITGVFESCPPRGCYEPNSSGALFNEAKRRTPVGTNPITVNFIDFANMQNEIGIRLGLRSQNKALSTDERAKLQNIPVINGVVGESSLVKITGFIPAVGNGLKEGSIETVNCKFSNQDEKDIHIPFAPRSSSTEYKGIVIEMIPQNRSAGWTLTKLKLVRSRKKKVMIVGGLFYDNEHLVNADPSRPLSGHSKRFSLWEIHPVTQVFVCARANNSCRAESVNGWTALENYQ